MIDPSTHPASLFSVRQSFQFKMFGSKRLKHLDRTIDVASEIWNQSVALKNRYYKMFGKGLPKSRLQAHLAKLRRTRFAHWKSVDSQSVQAITDRLYLGWEAFFKGDIKRPPTFRKRRKYRSFTLKQSGHKVLGHGRIKVLGRTYRFNQSRPLTGIIKTGDSSTGLYQRFLHNIFV
jgi:putative transposase